MIAATLITTLLMACGEERESESSENESAEQNHETVISNGTPIEAVVGGYSKNRQPEGTTYEISVWFINQDGEPQSEEIEVDKKMYNYFSESEDNLNWVYRAYLDGDKVSLDINNRIREGTDLQAQ